MKFLRIGMLALGVVSVAIAAETPKMDVITNDTSEWIPLYGEEWFNYFHPDWMGYFPGGKNNAYHDKWVQAQWAKHPITKDWTIFNKSHVFDGEWFAVEWFYQATYLADGFTEWETTLGIGKLKEGKLVLWIEYFDDNVGKLQKLGLMPFPSKEEPVFPWPEKAKINLPYRP